MSRSALWRQEAGVQDRERQAREIFEMALQEGKNRPVKGLISMVIKDVDTFNLHPTLLQSVSSSPYFLKLCQNILDWNALVDEIYYQVQHLEPFMIQGSGSAAHKVSSPAFCLLLRLFTLRCTEKQMHLMLNHVDSPYIRCIGFLFLRYVGDPAQIFTFFKPYLYDEEPVQIEATRPHSTIGKQSTVGYFVRFLLHSLDYYGTKLPRFPVHIERDIKVQLLQFDEIETRAQLHQKDAQIMQYLQTVGNHVQALYQDSENPLAWYDAVVDRVIFHDPKAPSDGQGSGASSKRPKFIVTFTEYGNTETVALGEIQPPFQANGRFHDKNSTMYRNHNDRDHNTRDDLRKEILQRDRDHALANGKQYASRPKSVKESLTSDQPYANYPQQESYSHKRARVNSPTTATDKKIPDRNLQSAPKLKSFEDIAAIEEKKRKLMARYG